MKEITFEKFVKKYKPIKNSEEEFAPYGGFMFETFDEDLKKVMACENQQLWTLVDADYNTSYIVPGFHFVNRVGYFITEVPWKTEQVIVNLNNMITVGEAKYECVAFIEKQLNIPAEEFEDKLDDWWSSKF